MRTLALLSLAVVLLLVQSVLHTLVPIRAPLPDFALLTPMYVALSPRWSTSGTACVGLFAGYLFDLVSGAPVGVHALITPLTVLLGIVLATRLQIRGPFGRAVAALLLTLFYGAMVRIVSRLMHSGSAAGFGGLALEALLSAAAAPLVFSLLDRVERRFDRSAVRIGPRGGRRGETGIELWR